MIKKACFTTEWIEQVSSELHYNDKNLIEKVIRALFLLEMLVKAGCPLVFKGGTSLLLMLGKSAHRLSIDIDVICPPGTDIEDYLKSFADFGFTNLELVERKQRDDADIPKGHSKFFYQVAYRNDAEAQSYILLDVLYEDIHYFHTRQIAIDCPFIQLEGEPLMVTVPSEGDILGDKLTAFAPNTTGIPYYKNGRSCSMEIAKQLYDVGRLFENVSDLRITTGDVPQDCSGRTLVPVFGNGHRTGIQRHPSDGSLHLHTGKSRRRRFRSDTRRNHPYQVIHVQAALPDRQCHY